MAQRVLVTAGATGIGREIARAFEEGGSCVFVCDMDASALDVLRRESPAIRTGQCDVSRRADVEHVMSEVVDNLGGLDVLVNNAGIQGPTAPVEAIDPDDWEAVVDTNLNGTFNVTRLAVPHLKQSSAGVIISISSVAGRLGYPNRAAYASSKWGVIGLTKTLAMELGAYGIRANAILPGAVEGPRIERVFEARAEASGRPLDEIRGEAMAFQSIKRLVDPRDIAALAVFLASDHAKSISGATICIDNDMP